MIIHFVCDSIYIVNFIKYIERNFDLSNHIFILLTSTEPKFLRCSRNVFIYRYASNFDRLRKIRFYIKTIKPKKIFLHGLTNENLIPIMFAKKNMDIFWIVWGGDLYTNINYRLYDNKTESLINYSNKRKTVKQKLILILRSILIKRINYIAVNSIEFNIIKNNYKIKAIRKDFFYPNDIQINEINNYLFNKDSKIILLGNSGDTSNNHISILEKLAKISVNIDFKVFVPLSYGENTKYIELIKNKGMELLGNRFIPLFNFMKFEEYIKLLSSVDIVIMNHYRQQAVGNLRFLLAKGKKVYLNEKNPLYHYFKSEGIFLSNINECNFDVDFFIDYSNEIKLNNQEHIEKLFSNENILKYMNILFG